MTTNLVDSIVTHNTDTSGLVTGTVLWQQDDSIGLVLTDPEHLRGVSVTVPIGDVKVVGHKSKHIEGLLKGRLEDLTTEELQAELAQLRKPKKGGTQRYKKKVEKKPQAKERFSV